MRKIFTKFPWVKLSRGFTLIEITIALLVLAIGLLGLLALFPVGFNASRKAGNTTQAAILAQKYVEDLKRVGYTNLITNTPDGEAGWVEEGTTAAGANFNYFAFKRVISDPTDNFYRQVEVTICWPAPSADPSSDPASLPGTLENYKVVTYIPNF